MINEPVMMVFFIIFLCRREFRGWVIFDVCWDKKVYKSVALIKKVIKKVKKLPEAISCADQKTKAKKCPRLPLFLKSLSSFAGGNFGGGCNFFFRVI